MQLGHPSEMEAYEGQRDSQWEHPVTAEQGPEKEPPIGFTFNSYLWWKK
jgi:hypothetical protein